MTRPGRPSRRITPGAQALASPRDRLRASAYDFLILTGIGSVLFTAFVWITGRDPIEEGGGLLAAAFGGLVLLSAVYEVPSTALTGQTIGKRIAGVRVSTLDGSTPGWRRSARRWVLFLPFGLMHEVSLAAPVITGGSVINDPAYRGIHDHFAGTVVMQVVDAPTSKDPLKPRKRR